MISYDLRPYRGCRRIRGLNGFAALPHYCDDWIMVRSTISTKKQKRRSPVPWYVGACSVDNLSYVKFRQDVLDQYYSEVALGKSVRIDHPDEPGGGRQAKKALGERCG